MTKLAQKSVVYVVQKQFVLLEPETNEHECRGVCEGPENREC